jgi:hypothetical protein
MEEQTKATEGQGTTRKGPIVRMIDWTLGILFCITLTGLAYRFIILPLFWR